VSEPIAESLPRPARAWRSPLAWVVLLGVFGIGLALDLGLKQWAFDHVAGAPVNLSREVVRDPYWQIPPHEAVVAIPRLLSFHLVANRGAVFGSFADKRAFLIVFTVAALVAAIVVFGRWTTASSFRAHVAIALILAGGVGNLYDRIQFGFVRDFLHMLPGWTLPFGWSWGDNTEVFPWVFNVADVMLLAGMGTLMWHMHVLEKQRKTRREALEAKGAAATNEAGVA